MWHTIAGGAASHLSSGRQARLGRRVHHYGHWRRDKLAQQAGRVRRAHVATPQVCKGGQPTLSPALDWVQLAAADIAMQSHARSPTPTSMQRMYQRGIQEQCHAQGPVTNHLRHTHQVSTDCFAHAGDDLSC